MTTTSHSDIDIHAVLAERREIAIIWSIADVLEVRPDLSEESAWAVLQACERRHDATLGITWDDIEWLADALFPSQHAGSAA